MEHPHTCLCLESVSAGHCWEQLPNSPRHPRRTAKRDTRHEAEKTVRRGRRSIFLSRTTSFGVRFPGRHVRYPHGLGAVSRERQIAVSLTHYLCFWRVRSHEFTDLKYFAKRRKNELSRIAVDHGRIPPAITEALLGHGNVVTVHHKRRLLPFQVSKLVSRAHAALLAGQQRKIIVAP